MLAELLTGLQGNQALSMGNNSTQTQVCSRGSCLQQLFVISTSLSILLGLALLAGYTGNELLGDTGRSFQSFGDGLSGRRKVISGEKSLVCVYRMSGLGHRRLGALFKLKWINTETGDP